MNLWTIAPLEVGGWGRHFRGHTEVNSDIKRRKYFIFLRKKPHTDKRYNNDEYTSHSNEGNLTAQHFLCNKTAVIANKRLGL